MTLLNRQLFAETYLRDLQAERAAAARDDAVDACHQIIAEWREVYPALTETDALSAYLGHCFSALGFAYDPCPDPTHFVLYGDEARSQPLGICLAVTDEQIGRMTKGRHYQVQLIKLLREWKLTWGIVTNGRDWRLCYAKASAVYEVYLQANLDVALDRQSAEFAPFYHFFSRAAFELANGEQRLDAMLAKSEKQTQAIERHLKSRVEGVLQSLCLGFVADASAATFSRDQLDEVYRNAIYLLYRVLFLFYAEARELLPVSDPAYSDHSLAAIVELARQRQAQGEKQADPYALWKRLSHLCVVVDEGAETLNLRPYNGGLFSDQENPYLRAHKLTDDYLAPAIFDLAFVESHAAPELIDYRDLSVRHLGTLYEGMLEYRLNLVQDEPVVLRESKGKRAYIRQSDAAPIKRGETIMKIGEAYFADDRGERKSSGSFYTPEDVVQYNVANTVVPKLQERVAALLAQLVDLQRERAIAVTDAERERIERYADQCVLETIEQLILTIKVLDLAMGSAHFLVAAGQAMTNFIVELLNSTDWPNDALSTDPLFWKRRVVERCLYGVDLNPLSHELAKLALWLSSASEGKPLTFLDHHLKVGNSLYGAPLARLSTLPGAKPAPTGKQPQGADMFQAEFHKTIQHVLAELAKITGVDSDRIEDVKAKGEANRAAEASAQRLRDLAHVWLATLFGLQNDDDKPIDDGQYFDLLQAVVRDVTPEEWELYVAETPLLCRAHAIANERANRFFHWELEFADAVIDGVCQFDVILANPPYVGTPPNRAITYLYQTAKCGDLYAWMFERALKIANAMCAIGMIVPLSVMFSRQFKPLRKAILQRNGVAFLAAFDNNPASVFGLSDTRNSQRACNILMKGSTSSVVRVNTTNLLRWTADERPYLLSNLRYADVTPFANEANFPKLGDPILAEFWSEFRKSNRTLNDVCKSILSESVKDNEAAWFLIVPRAVRYFLSAFPVRINRNKVLTLTFHNQHDRDLAAVLINSDIHYWYWLTYGDGFVTNVDIVAKFPVPELPESEVRDYASRLFDALDECVTYHNKLGERIPNYNFNRRMDILLDIDEWIVKHSAPSLVLSRTAFAQYKSVSFLQPLNLSLLQDERRVGG